MQTTDRTRPPDYHGYPLLLLHNGPDKDATFRLSDNVAFQVPGRIGNTLVALQAAWRRDADEHRDDRGWIDAAGVQRLFRSELGKVIEEATAQSYIDFTTRTLTRQFRSLRLAAERVPVQKSRGRGIRLVAPLTVKDPTGRIRWAAAS